MTLTIRGRVTEVDGRRIAFALEAWDGVDKVCEGTHERTVILAGRFNEKLANKAGA
jgi:fluoroacetyl-CoA thioesterase